MAEEEAPQAAAEDVTKQFWEGTFNTPAVRANHSSVLDISSGIRAVFGEVYSETSPIWPRAAVVLDDVSAYQLWIALGQSVAVQRVQNFLAEQQADAQQD